MVSANTHVLINGEPVKYQNFIISREGGRIVDSATVILPGNRQVSQWSRIEIVQDKVDLTDIKGLYALSDSFENEYGYLGALQRSKDIKYINGHFGNTVLNDDNSNGNGFYIGNINIVKNLSTNYKFDISFWYLPRSLVTVSGGFISTPTIAISGSSGISMRFSTDNNKRFNEFRFKRYTNTRDIFDIQKDQWMFVRIYSFDTPQNSSYNTRIEINGVRYNSITNVLPDINGEISLHIDSYYWGNISNNFPILQSEAQVQTLTLWGKYLLNGNLNDTSGNSRNLVLTSGSATYVTGKYGNALQLSGNAAYTPSWNRDQDWHICMWYLNKGSNAGWGPEKQDQIAIDLNSTTPRVYVVNDVGAWQTLSGITRPAYNTWVFVEMSYDYSARQLKVKVGNQTWTRNNSSSGRTTSFSRLFLPHRSGQNNYDNIAIKVGSLFTDDEVAEIKNNFTPSDSTPPTLTSATYATGNGSISLLFSENIKDVDRTKFGFVGGNLTTGLPSNYVINGNTITATFSSAHRSLLNAANTIMLNISAGAVSDTAGNPISSRENISVTISDTIKPTLLSTSRYTRLTGTLHLLFSENIKTANTQNITITDNTSTVTLPSTKTINNNSVTVTLSPTDRIKFNMSDNMFISIPTNTIYDNSDNVMDAILRNNLTIEGNKISPQPIDETKPVYLRSSFYVNTKTIEIVFTKNIVKVSTPNIYISISGESQRYRIDTYSINGNRILLKMDDDDADLLITRHNNSTYYSRVNLSVGLLQGAVTSTNGNSNAIGNHRTLIREYKVPDIFAKREELNSYGYMLKNVRVKVGDETFTSDQISDIVNYVEPTHFMRFGGRVQSIVREDDKTILKCLSYGSEIARADTITTGSNTSPEAIIEQSVGQDTVSMNFVNMGGPSNVTLNNFKNRGKLVENIKKLVSVGGYEFLTSPLGTLILYKNHMRIFATPLVHGFNGVSITRDVRNDQNFRNSIQSIIPETINTGQVTHHTKIQPYGIFRYNPSSGGTEIPSSINVGNPITSLNRIYARWSAAGLYDKTNNVAQPSRTSSTNFLSSGQYSVSGQIVNINSAGRQKLMPDRIPNSINADYVDLRVDLYVEYSSTQTSLVDIRGISQKGFSNIQSNLGSTGYLTKEDIIKSVESDLISNYEIPNSIIIRILGNVSPFMEGDVICAVNDRLNINANYLIKTIEYNHAESLTTIHCNEYNFNEIDDRDNIVRVINEFGNALKEIDFVKPTIMVDSDTFVGSETFEIERIHGTELPARYDEGRYDQSRYGVVDTGIFSTKAYYDSANTTYDGDKVYG